jgi:hypothetical protein
MKFSHDAHRASSCLLILCHRKQKAMQGIRVGEPPANIHLDPQALVAAVYTGGYALQGDCRLESTDRYLRLVAKNIEQAVHARENGNFYALHTAGFPIEFFWPLGITPLSVEIYSTIVGIVSGNRQPLLSLSDRRDVPCYNCSTARTFDEIADLRAWPTPDLYVYYGSTSDPRPPGIASGAARCGIPSIGVDRPDDFRSPQELERWVSGNRLLLRFLEAQTGRTMHQGLLREATKLSYRALQVYAQINELRRAIPCPLPAEAACAPAAVYRAWAGTQACLDFLEQLRDELQDRVARGIGAAAHETFRYAFDTVVPCFNFAITSELEKRCGAVNVMDHLQWWRDDGEWLLDRDDPVVSLAWKARFERPDLLAAQAAEHVKALRRAAIRCKVDGVIHINNRCSSRVTDESRALQDAIERSLGLPWIQVDCDTLNPSRREFDVAMDQLEAFFASVKKRPRLAR